MDFVGTVQFFDRNGKRSNPIALFLEHGQGECSIASGLPQLRHIVGAGATPNKAAGDFEAKLKAAFPQPGAYDGPSWNGIKAEKPSPPKPVTAPGVPPSETPATIPLATSSSPSGERPNPEPNVPVPPTASE